MSLQDSLFFEDVECDVVTFSRDKRRKRVLIFPPVNNYRRFIIHQLVQDRFSDTLDTFSIGQGNTRRTVVCYKTDVIRHPKLNGAESTLEPILRPTDTVCRMGVEGRQSPSGSPDRTRQQRQVKSVPTIEIYRPPAARKAKNNLQNTVHQTHVHQPITEVPAFTKNNRQKRPDRAVYVPRPRRSRAAIRSPQILEGSQTEDLLASSSSANESLKLYTNDHHQDSCYIEEQRKTSRVEGIDYNCADNSVAMDNGQDSAQCDNVVKSAQITLHNRIPLDDVNLAGTDLQSQDILAEYICDSNQRVPNISEIEDPIMCVRKEVCEDNNICTSCTDVNETTEEYVNEPVIMSNTEDNSITESPANEHATTFDQNAVNINTCSDIDPSKNSVSSPRTCATDTEDNLLTDDNLVSHKNRHISPANTRSDVLIISDDTHKEEKKTKDVSTVPIMPPEKKVKKIERPKSKPAPPPLPPIKINREECDWDSLFDDNGDCLDPTLIEELTSAVGEVAIEQPKNDYKAYSKHIEVGSDEFAHVVEIYNFPTDFKTSDLATVFSPFKNGGFELKWVDDTHCLGVFSSPLIAAEVLASDHPFVKTRPLSEATALSKTKAKRSAEFLQPYRSRPETCAALARRLVTGALGVKLATARQEREHEKNVLREAKEKRRLANKQREDAWEGIIPEK